LRRPFSALILLLLGCAAVLAGVSVPVSFACQAGQVFEYDGCVPSPLLYNWTDSSPAAATTPSVCIWDMPWGPTSLPCNVMNCQTIIYPTGYPLQSQPVKCSYLSVSVERIRLRGAAVPVAGDTVSVSAMLTCEGPADTAGQVFINVSMTGKTDPSGNATFLIPSTLDNSPGGSRATCYSAGSDQAANGFAIRETASGMVSADLSWPGRQSAALLLPSSSGDVVKVRGHSGWFSL